MAKKKGSKKKPKKKEKKIEDIAHSLEKSPAVCKLSAEEKEFAERMEKVTKKIDHVLSANEEVQVLKKEIKEKPLTYAALAFTAGVALCALLKGRH
ncbi:hypothetical protein GF412_05170 [Candidatus Micrarchaeota archaeon]|nr:hypothetical protein [Candidatus Micrarchaeota archaeon]MBD3418345.1 hypothetical protein [Candidatus Micrarchaeota archaeon]